MTVRDFEDYELDKNIEKGNRYFRQERVMDLKKVNDEDWEASVRGRDMYEVIVTLDQEEIELTSCSCPVFTEEDNCKHVIAVFYAIREKMGLQPPAAIPAEQIEALLQLLPVDTLRSFLAEQLEDNKKMRNAFQALGYEKLHTLPVEQFTKAITGDPAGILIAAKQQLQAAKEAGKIKDYSAVVSRCLAVLTVLPAAPENTGEKNKKIISLVQEAFYQLYDLYDASEFDDYNSMRVYAHAARLVQDPVYPISDYDPHWVDLLWQNVESENDKQVLSLLDAMLVTAVNKNNQEDLERLETINRSYREIIGAVKTEKAKPVDKHPDYSLAKQTLLDAMEEALQKNDTGNYSIHRDALLQLMQQRSDVLGTRKIAEQCFKETREPRYYEILKDTYMKTEWEKVKAQFGLPGRTGNLRVV